MATAKFVIISTQRSGSTLIRTSLDSHPDISCYGEVFLSTYNREHSYYEYLKKRGVSNLSEVIRRRSLSLEFLDHLYRSSTTAAVGFKVMYNQLRYRPYRFPMVMGYLRRHKIRVIHLVRNNSLKTGISGQAARITGTYHTNEELAQSALEIDVDLLLKDLRWIEEQKSWCRSALSDIPSVEISYEDFVAHKSEISVLLLEFLNIDTSIPLVSPLKKVLSLPLHETVSNYDELEVAVSKAGFARFLQQ